MHTFSKLGTRYTVYGTRNYVYESFTNDANRWPLCYMMIHWIRGALGSWMSSNRLRLNPHKTQFILLGTHQQLAKLDMVALTSAFPNFTFSSTVRDLGVSLDQELPLAPHIPSLRRACYYQLRQLRTVSRSLTSTAAATLVHSFVTSRLDYCSSLYIGLPATRLNG